MSRASFWFKQFRLIFFIAILAGLAAGQDITGAIGGVVTDPSGTAVAGASVTAVNLDTNQPATVKTNQEGDYELVSLKPGRYELRASFTGFKTSFRQSLTLQVGGRLRIDFPLEIGDTTTSVVITGEGPLVDLQTASLGQDVTAREVESLPIKGRTIYDLALLVPGVEVNPAGIGRDAATGNGGLFPSADISINGGRYRTNDYLLDGVSIMLPDNNEFALSPTPDGTQEFNLLTNSYGPQFGRSGGGVFNVVTKGGTNQLHGTAYEFFRNDLVEANLFFANAQGQARPAFHFNLFGGAVGGPIVKNKTFFFAEYQGFRDINSLGGQFLTLPTALERQGDFSQTRSQAGQPVTIYNPFTTTAVAGGGFTRTPFPGNIIPESMFDKVAVKMLSFIPLPNRAGQGPNQINNFGWSEKQPVDGDQWSVRIDQRFSDKHSLFGRVTRVSGDFGSNGPFGNAADNLTGIDQSHAINAVLNDIYTISPSAVLNIRFGATRRFELRNPLHGAIGLSNLGFPQAVASAATLQTYPPVSFTNYSVWGDPSGDAIRRGNDLYSLVGDETLVRGRHTIIFGGEGRLYNSTPYQAGSDSGTYGFSPSFTQGPNPQVTSLTAGDAFASFLTGYGTGSISQTPALAIRNMYYALYANDQIKLGKLSIDAGLRWEYAGPLTERYNRFATFDFNAPFPISIPGLPDLNGVLTHPGQNGQPRGEYDSYWKSFGPRFGLAYAFNAKTVIRSGYGIFYAPRFQTTSAANFGTSGASLSTSWVSSLDGVTPLNPLSNPYPTGVFAANTTQAAQLLLGQSLQIMDRANVSNIYNQQWNFDVQRELAGNFLIDVGYAGNKGTHLPIGLDFDQINPIYQSLGTHLSDQVPNPFYGLATTGTLSTPTVAQSVLLRPYPQYTSVSTTSPAVAENVGSSSYHALQAKLERRLSHGVSFLVSYTTSKLIDDGAGRVVSLTAFSPPVQNIYNLRAERSVSPGDISQVLVISHVVELPFGKGKHFLSGANRMVDAVIGGWNLTGIATFTTGFPLALTSSGNSGVGSAVLRPNNNGKSANLSGSVESRLGQYFNTADFSIPPPFTFGNTAATLPDVRAPSRRNYDLSLAKRFSLTERFSLLVRAEAYDLTNTPYFGVPGTALGSGSFGVISSATGQRQMQFAMKFLF